MATPVRETEVTLKSQATGVCKDSLAKRGRPVPEAARTERPALSAPQTEVLRLQRSHGNRHVQRVVTLARQAEGDAEVTPEIEAAIDRERSGGQALDRTVSAQMERFFGTDFSTVRIHTGDQANQLNRSLSARAFTTGRDIFFREGEYNPASTTGRELLAHELTHVTQQMTGSVQRALSVASPESEDEREANQMARWVSQSEQDSHGLLRRQHQLGSPRSGAAADGLLHRDSAEEAEKWTGSTEQVAFRDAVLNAHLARSRKAKGSPIPDLTEDELGLVVGTGVRMRKDAAEAASSLLAAANGDLATAKEEKDADALKTLRLSATSGYRSSGHQERVWKDYFEQKYYNDTIKNRAKLAGGPHGDKAVSWMVAYIRPKVAAPGFSNHQAGLAIDFLQVRSKGNPISNSTNPGAVARWKETWFFGWLEQNASTHGFEPYPAEPWHWNFSAEETGTK
ncbi:MAG TPA: DUF4157 domain-containing protein [Thermoanaerobaculia bacterium]